MSGIGTTETGSPGLGLGIHVPGALHGMGKHLLVVNGILRHMPEKITGHPRHRAFIQRHVGFGVATSTRGLWQQNDLHSQEPSSQEQGKVSVKTTRRAELSSSRVSDGGAGPERDGAILRRSGFPAGSAKSRLCLDLGAQPLHGGDEEPVRLHAGHDVRDGPSELSAVHDDGKAWKHHGVNGKQSVSDDDDVTGVPGGVGCLHGNDEPSARGGLSQCGECRGGECFAVESARQHGEPQSSRTLRPKWSSKIVTAAAAWSMMVPFRHASPQAQQFLAQKRLVDDVWIIRSDDVPASEWIFPKVCPDRRASSISALPEPPQLCQEDRAFSVSGLCQPSQVCGDRRAPSTHELCHLPQECPDECGGWEVAREGAPCKIGNLNVPAGSFRLSQIFHSSKQLESTLEEFPVELIMWLQVEDIKDGTLMESRPYSSLSQVGLPEHQSFKCTLWCVSPKAHWVSCWADHNSSVVNFNEDFAEGPGPYWAVSSTEISEALGEEEGRELPVKGHQTELKRCGLSLASMVQKEKRDCKLDFMELFSPPRVSPLAQQLGLRISDQVFDLEAGWDVRKVDHRRQFRQAQQDQRPGFLMTSPECKGYSPLMNVNWPRMDPAKAQQIRREGELMWNFAVESCETQDDQGDFFALEHPANASSWKLPRTQRLLRRSSVAVIEFDMCAFGLTVVRSGDLSRKRTKIATNHPWLAAREIIPTFLWRMDFPTRLESTLPLCASCWLRPPEPLPYDFPLHPLQNGLLLHRWKMRMKEKETWSIRESFLGRQTFWRKVIPFQGLQNHRKGW